jgi:hypothetical protein
MHKAAFLYVVKLKEGVRPKTGDTLKLLEDPPVVLAAFIETEECDRKVLRMIISDPDGIVDRKRMNKAWRHQWNVRKS